MYYSEQQLIDLENEAATVPQKCQFLLFSYYDRQYQSVRGREFALQGFSRRIGTLRRCIDRVFALLPPSLEDIPSADVREDATIALQAFVFNVFGCLDNLAWVWVEEKAVRKANGTPLAPNTIGLGTKYTRVRESFSDSFRAYLQSREEWFAHVEGYRHALAHRIALYIPPHNVSPVNQAAYMALEQQITAAVISGDANLESGLRSQQQSLMFFRPWMTHSFAEQAPVMVIHPQILADFNTVDELALRMLAELNQP